MWFIAGTVFGALAGVVADRTLGPISDASAGRWRAFWHRRRYESDLKGFARAVATEMVGARVVVVPDDEPHRRIRATIIHVAAPATGWWVTVVLHGITDEELASLNLSRIQPVIWDYGRRDTRDGTSPQGLRLDSDDPNVRTRGWFTDPMAWPRQYLRDPPPYDI